jgi:hypothetical protein
MTARPRAAYEFSQIQPSLLAAKSSGPQAATERGQRVVHARRHLLAPGAISLATSPSMRPSQKRDSSRKRTSPIISTRAGSSACSSRLPENIPSRYRMLLHGTRGPQAAGSAYWIYNAQGGFTAVGMGFSASRFLTDHWLVSANLAWNRLQGHASASPITQSNEQGVVEFSTAYRW